MIIISGKSCSGKTNKLISFIKGNKDKRFVIISSDVKATHLIQSFGDDIHDYKITFYEAYDNGHIEEYIKNVVNGHDFDFVAIDQIREDEVGKYKEIIESNTSAEALLLVQEQLNQGCSRVDFLRKDLLKKETIITWWFRWTNRSRDV